MSFALLQFTDQMFPSVTCTCRAQYPCSCISQPERQRLMATELVRKGLENSLNKTR